MNPAYLALLTGALALLVALVGLLVAWRLRQRMSQITPDTRRLAARMQGNTVANALGEIIAHLEDISGRLIEVEHQNQRLIDGYAQNVQKVGLVRFDQDEQVSGNLSFALALLDGSDNGVIITSLYSLEGCRVFVRSLRQRKARHGLLPEEELALARALGEVNKQQ